ncbi:hypothetical protein MRX96_003932 [Rhipicephalus microplus]
MPGMLRGPSYRKTPVARTKQPRNISGHFGDFESPAETHQRLLSDNCCEGFIQLSQARECRCTLMRAGGGSDSNSPPALPSVEANFHERQRSGLLPHRVLFSQLWPTGIDPAAAGAYTVSDPRARLQETLSVLPDTSQRSKRLRLPAAVQRRHLAGAGMRKRRRR